jgi:hypothetical protein
VLPIAPDHIALEGATRADRHRQNIARLWDGLDLDLFAESNVAVCDSFRGLLPLAAEAQGRNPETYLDCLRHSMSESGTPLCMIARVAVYSLTAYIPSRAFPCAARACGAELVRPTSYTQASPVGATAVPLALDE